MFDPIQYMIAQEGSGHNVSERHSILDNIEDKYPGVIESEVTSFKKGAIALAKSAEDVVKKANIPGIAVYFNTKMFEEIDSLSLIPSIYVEKMGSLQKSQKYLSDSDNYDSIIDEQYIVFDIHTFSASNTSRVNAASKYGSDKNPKSSSSGSVGLKFTSFVEDLYNKLKGNTNFWGMTYSGDWTSGMIEVVLKPSDKFISIARKCGY